MSTRNRLVSTGVWIGVTGASLHEHRLYSRSGSLDFDLGVAGEIAANQVVVTGQGCVVTRRAEQYGSQRAVLIVNSARTGTLRSICPRGLKPRITPRSVNSRRFHHELGTPDTERQPSRP